MSEFYHLDYSLNAQNDLKHIYHTGLSEWGERAADAYLRQILSQCALLSHQPQIGRHRQEILMDLRSLVVKQHIIFYQIIESRIRIVRILNCREDVEQHLT